MRKLAIYEVGKTMSRGVLPIVLSALVGLGNIPLAFAAVSEPQLNFKIYSPDSTGNSSAEPAKDDISTPAANPPTDAESANVPPADNPATPAESKTTTATDSAKASDSTADSTTKDSASPTGNTAESVSEKSATEKTGDALRAETPSEATSSAKTGEASSSETPSEAAATAKTDQATDGEAASPTASQDATSDSESKTESATGEGASKTTDKAGSGKTLQGYIRVVPSGTKIPIVMDTAVDSDTSQEGDEFSARTAEDLTIDGSIAVPAGSIIKGRIAQMNAPKHMDRSGSVALKFDTVTTPDNRQIPLVANLVAHGGVVHARRGLKDVAIDSSIVMLPTVIGLGIGALAGSNNNNSSSSSGSTSSISKADAAVIGVGVGLVVGVAVLLAKKGKKVDVRPGDELKIQLTEDLRMPMM